MNILGNFLTFSTFGESHGEAYGGIITNFPAGLDVDFDKIQNELNRRKPAQSALVSQRKESDKIQFLSGIFAGKTLGSPIAFLVKNENQKSEDYDLLKTAYRPNHADFTYEKKFSIRDYRGGGRASARETLNWVAAGALARQLIPEIEINAYVSQVGEIVCKKNYENLDFSLTETSPVRCPDEETAKKMIEKIYEVKKSGDSIGGAVTCVIRNAPIGLGEPVFMKLQAELAKAMLSIPACKGFEYGSGFDSAKMIGSQHNDIFDKNFKTKTNFSGGIHGGISNGMDIYFRLALKPTATIMQPQETVDNNGNKIILQPKGRHDPFLAARAVPIVENLAAFVLADLSLIGKIRTKK